MSRHTYRCSRCRARNVFAHAVEWYKVARKCKACNYTRFYADKERVRRESCSCDGGLLGRTGSIPHRPGSPCCVLHPRHIVNRALRMGATREDITDLEIEMAWTGEGGRVMGAEDPVPF